MDIINSAAPYVRSSVAYVAGLSVSEVALERGIPEGHIVKLASNENPLGTSAAVGAALLGHLGDLNRYPDASGLRLKRAISERYSVPTDWITLGNGSNHILELATRAFVERGQSTVHSEFSFATYAKSTQAVGGRGIVVAALNYGHDLEAMRRAIVGDTKVVFLANPNNPTGTFIDGAELESFINDVPRRVLVVLDEAYTEYLSENRIYDSLSWLVKFPHLLVCRTFSKAFGLAALRVGFGCAQPEVTGLLNKVRQPFALSGMAQAAAIAALHDEQFLRVTLTTNDEGRCQLYSAFETLGLGYLKSEGNFVLVRVGDAITSGAIVLRRLLEHGIIVRPVEDYGLPQWLRVSVGLQRENGVFLQGLALALDRVKGECDSS
ncbi:histidinol-phosphate transaminase [Burkholderia sp. S171]|uniref:histidinol-phosphate transaminase n=1 Tax=Burkholderia sp. S171 TaxID=1641860 RepID=UPI00131D9BC8|nr:histidinol-phosphate transaminase [Burkholderia sp. S171]